MKHLVLSGAATWLRGYTPIVQRTSSSREVATLTQISSTRRRQRKWSTFSIYMGCLVLGVLISRGALAFREVENLVSYPFLDDTFFVLSIAKNLAAGHWFSVNGSTLTNGFHPLLAFIYAPIYLFTSDPIWAIRIAQGVSAVIDAGLVYAAAKLFSSIAANSKIAERAALSFGAIWLVSDSVVLQSSNGLETNLTALILLIVLRSYHSILQNPRISVKRHITLGLTLGLLILARIDMTLIVGSLVIFEAFRLGRGKKKMAALLAVLPLLVSLPWWVYNIACFGNPMPISGQAESLFVSIPENLDHAMVNLSNMLVQFGYITVYGTPKWAHFLWAFGVISIWLAIICLTHLVDWLRHQYKFQTFAPICLGAIMITSYYTFLFRGSFFIARYFHTDRLLIALFLGMSGPIILEHVKARLSNKAFHVCCIALLVIIIGFNGIRYGRYFGSSNHSNFYHAGIWATSHQEGRVGMISSGTANYFANNIVNLDGKVNPGALTAQKAGTIGKYIQDQDLMFIADARTTSPKGKSVNQQLPLCLDSVLAQSASVGLEYELFDSLPSPDGITPIMLIYKKRSSLNRS